jgi:hypothetical protein
VREQNTFAHHSHHQELLDHFTERNGLTHHHYSRSCRVGLTGIHYLRSLSAPFSPSHRPINPAWPERLRGSARDGYYHTMRLEIRRWRSSGIRGDTTLSVIAIGAVILKTRGHLASRLPD